LKAIMAQVSESDRRELLALIWALKDSDLGNFIHLVQSKEDGIQATTADSANSILYKRLIEIGIAREMPNPMEMSDMPISMKENFKAYALTPEGKEILRGGLKLLATGWPPRGSQVTPRVIELLAKNSIDRYRPAQARAIAKMAALHVVGNGIKQDVGVAIELYRKAADLGDTTALNNLGVMYGRGEGVSRDSAQAVAYFRRAADAGNAGAMENIGSHYGAGEGVEKNDEEAVKWFLKAAEAGRPNAMCFLADRYAAGRGVKQDYLQAYIWYSLGIKGGRDARAPRDAVAAHLSPEQVRDANEHIIKWKPVAPEKQAG
jgi:hypothetical protein